MRGNSLAARALARIGKRLHAQALFGGAATVVLMVAGLAGPASARAQGTQDFCLAGSWKADLTSVPALYTGTGVINFPSPSGGFAGLSVAGNKTVLSEGEPVIIPASGGVAGEGYAVSSASTPAQSGGVVNWTAVDTDGLYNGNFHFTVVPVLPSDYTCTAATLELPITLDVVEEPVVFGLASFTRSGPGPAALSVTTAGQGSGTVTSGSSIDCASAGGPSCSAWVPAGGSVTLDAAASPGSAFAGWTGLCSGNGPECHLTLSPDQEASATAQFEPLHRLSVAKAGSGHGEVSSAPSGISCPPGSSACPPASFTHGTRVKLTATPASGSVFQGWSGACAGQTCEVSMDSDTSVTATFQPSDLVHSLSVSKEGKGAGTVNSEPAGVECGSLCSAWFLRGTPVMLRAVAAVGSSFGGWSGSCSGTGKCLVVMNDDESVTASFTASPAETALAQGLSKLVATLAKLAQSRLSIPFHASGPGVLTISLYAAPPGGRLARMSRAKAILVAVGRHSFARAGTAKIKIKLTRTGKALLKHYKRLMLTAKGIFRPGGKTAVAHTETFVLRRHTANGLIGSSYTSPDLWATIDVCNPSDQRYIVGVRGSMPSDGLWGESMFMRFRLQYLAEGRWVDLAGADSGLLPLPPGYQQDGRSFTLSPPPSGTTYTLRGLVSFQWRRGSTMLAALSRATSAGRQSGAGADPPGYSAAQCRIS